MVSKDKNKVIKNVSFCSVVLSLSANQNVEDVNIQGVFPDYLWLRVDFQKPYKQYKHFNSKWE